MKKRIRTIKAKTTATATRKNYKKCNKYLYSLVSGLTLITCLRLLYENQLHKEGILLPMKILQDHNILDRPQPFWDLVGVAPSSSSSSKHQQKLTTTILVTGAAGYIGSHTTLKLLEKGYNVIGAGHLSKRSNKVVEFLSSFEHFNFEQAELSSKADVETLFRKYPNIDCVVHLANYNFAMESTMHPALYKDNIEDGMKHIVDNMMYYNVSRLVYASTCAVYGNPDQLPVTEDTPTKPVSVYGQCKLNAENYIFSTISSLLKQSEGRHPRFVAHSMRYFNVVGADRLGRLGENPKFEISHTYKRLWSACRSVIEGKQPCVSTNDGHIRDYVHVEDVATANIAAIEAPPPTTMTSSESNAKHFIWNVASNKGITNRKFVETAERISGIPIPICKTDAGGGNNRTTKNEAVGIFGSSDRLQATLGWKPQYLTLESMLTTAYNYSYSQQRPQPSRLIQKQQQQQPETVIVMFDTRTLDVNVSSDYIPHRWTADLNHQYAKRHGYDFVYVQPEVYFEDDAPAEAVTMQTDGVNSIFKTRPTCHLNLPNGTKRGRGASWCRLLAVALMMERGYSTILFLDTDAAFLNHTLDLESLFPQIVQQQQQQGDGVAEDANLVWLPSNAPFNPHPRLPNGGMHIWRKPSIKSWRLIRQWWQLDIHPAIQCYEQDALWSIITGALVAYPCGGVKQPLRINPKCGVGVLQYEWMRSELFHSLPLVHIPSVSTLISKRKDVLQKEWREKILGGKEMIVKKNEVFEKVETLSGTEIERLQSILETRTDNRIC